MNNQSDTQTVLTFGEREFILLGTAHISRESVDEVAGLIAEYQPQRVCVELDQGRYQSLNQDQRWQNLDIFKILKEQKAFLLLGNLVLSASQKRMGLDMGVKPGEEMKAAIDTAKAAGIPVSLIDREIQVTLRRAWGLSGLWGKNKMLAALLAGAFTNEKITPEELEKLKQKSALQGMLEEVADFLPSAKKVLIDERDEYLAKKLFLAPLPGENKILAVVGAGHVPGMVRWLGELHEGKVTPEVTPIEVVPPPSLLARALPWLISILVIGLIAWGFAVGGVSEGFANFGRWVLVNGSLAGLGSLAALGHPLTILGSILAAPITSLNPTIGVGFVAGLMEAALRKPRVRDFEHLQEDILSVRGFYQNRVTRILMVFLFSSLGSAIGTFIGIPLLFPS
ncbi:MAG: TraB/GumN family protein [Spirochaetales bacterium]|nr:TraB/GumN family protein [Spirochaetales bacterium]